MRASVREAPHGADFPRAHGVSWHAMGDLCEATDWRAVLSNVQTVVHAAARVHVMQDSSANPLQAFRMVNVQASTRLARQAAASGVQRFVYLSSVKVLGEKTLRGRPFRASDPPRPEDPYAQSKFEAEQALQDIAHETGMQVVVVRPPLVYGPGVKANFERLVRAVAHGMPLPLGAIDNRRSLVGLDNLVDFLRVCVSHPAAANRSLLVSDGEDLSTADLVRRLARALGRPARLLPVPRAWLLCGGMLMGRHAAVQRLCEDLQVDLTESQYLLGWRPPASVEECLERTVAAWTGRASK